MFYRYWHELHFYNVLESTTIVTNTCNEISASSWNFVTRVSLTTKNHSYGYCFCSSNATISEMHDFIVPRSCRFQASIAHLIQSYDQ